MDDNQFCLLLLVSVNSRGQPQLDSLNAIFQESRLCWRALAYTQQGGLLEAMLTRRSGAVSQSLSCEDLQVHGGRAWSRSDWGQQEGAGGFRDRETFLRLL